MREYKYKLDYIKHPFEGGAIDKREYFNDRWDMDARINDMRRENCLENWKTLYSEVVISSKDGFEVISGYQQYH